MRIIEDDQVHSKASDGNWRPSQVVEEAKQRGLQAIALTDHDTTFGVPEAQETGKRVGVIVHSGIEVNSSYQDSDVTLDSLDILGLKMNLDLIQPLESKLSVYRHDALDRIIDKLNQYISSEEFERDDREKRYSLKSPRVMSVDDLITWKCEWNDYKCEVPYISDWEIAFYAFGRFAPHLNLEKRTLGGDRSVMKEIMREYPFLFQRTTRRPSWEEAMREIKNAEGLAVWSHPGRALYYQESGLIKEWELDENGWCLPERKKSPFAVAQKLAEKGLEGIELYYYAGNDTLHGHIQEQINKYFKLMAETFGLMVTYGSDCHGPRLREPYMGVFGSSTLIL
ncbi:TPA: PHP domain-containing protein [Candidatus Woesearchaeota archaeon]|nr:PHP domain-containing protein [Candidatus Woesearchaeota archaeon]